MFTDYGSGNVTLSAATLVSAGTSLPFSDDFSGGTGNWTTINDSGISASWTIIGGALQQQIRVENASGAFDQSYHKGTYAYYTAGTSLTNYRFSVDATFLGNTLADDIGIMFRYQNDRNYYRVSMNSRYGYTRLEKKVAGVFTPLAVNAIGYNTGQLLTFTVDLNGSLIQVMLNGDPLFAVNDGGLCHQVLLHFIPRTRRLSTTS